MQADLVAYHREEEELAKSVFKRNKLIQQDQLRQIMDKKSKEKNSVTVDRDNFKTFGNTAQA